MSAPEIELPILDVIDEDRDNGYATFQDKRNDLIGATGRIVSFGEIIGCRERQLKSALQVLATERVMHELLSRANTEIIQESNRLAKENAALKENSETWRKAAYKAEKRDSVTLKAFEAYVRDRCHRTVMSDEEVSDVIAEWIENEEQSL